MKNLDARSLCPPVPCGTAAKNKRDGCDDASAPLEPSAISPLGKNKFGKLNRDKHDPDALVSDGPQEIDPVHAPNSAIGRASNKRSDRGLLNEPLFGDRQCHA